MTTETVDQARRRLAAKARAEGVKLYFDRRDGRHYAASTSKPGTLYFLTMVSCTCPGFIFSGRCRHHSALLAAYGQIGPDPAAPACVNCGSRDVAHVDARSRWVGGARDGLGVETVIHRCGPCQRREGGALDRIAA